MILDALQYSFFQRALLAGLLASVACGVIGTFVVSKRISSISGGLSHAAFGGVGLGYLFGFSPMLGAAGFALVCALIIGRVYLKRKQSLDTLISILWSVGMALGVLFISQVPGYAPDLSSYLFGNILFVPPEYLLFVALLDVAVVVVTFLLFKELQPVSFDEEFSAVMGVSVESIFLLLLALTSLTVVVLIRVVGIIMTISLLTTPAVVARHWSENLNKMFVFSTLLVAVCTTVGLLLSYYFSAAFGARVPTGPLTILFATSLWGISSIVLSLQGRAREG